MKRILFYFFALLSLPLCAQTERRLLLAELLSARETDGAAGTVVTKLLTEERAVQMYDGMEEFHRVSKAEYTVTETAGAISVRRRVVENVLSEGKALSNGSADLTGRVMSGVLLPRKLSKKSGNGKGYIGMVNSASGDTVVVTIDKHAAIGDVAGMKVMGTVLTVEKSCEELVFVSPSGDLRLDSLKAVCCRLAMKEQPKGGTSHSQEWWQEIKVVSVSTETK